MRTFSVSNRMGAIAVIAASAIALAACGGGGGLNEDEAAGLRGEVEAAEAAQAAAEAARAAAEAAQKAAEAQAEADRAAKVTAETQAAADRAARETAQAQAEADRAAKVAAEAQAESALAAQNTAEAEAEAARTAQRTAEAEAEAARTAQAAAEAGQRQAELDKAAAESSSAEANRLAEQARMDKEAADRAAMEAADARDAALAEQTKAEDARDAAVTEQRDAEDARDAAVDKQQEAKDARDAAVTEQRDAERAKNRAEAELADAQDDLREANRRAETAEEAQRVAEGGRREAEGQVRQQAQTQEANQRGRGLLTALEAVLDGSNWLSPDNTASAVINDRDTDIALTASPLTGSTRKSGNFYTATLSRTAPGVNQPERKTVVYSDREKSRSFANHYANFINDDVGGTTSNPRFANSAWIGDLLGRASIVSNPSRGGHPTLIAADANDPAARLVSTLSARVHGVTGHYGCYDSTTNAACKVNVAAAYIDVGGTTDTRKELATLTISPEGAGALYFDPGSGTISLLNVAKTGAPATTDAEYITFGWWQERPALADGTYSAAVFAAVSSGETYAIGTGTGSAEYQGPAVGLYVDRQSDGSETTYESGDFTATAILRATFSGGPVGVEGDVTNFRTTHGARNWHVKLEFNADGSAGTAEIVQAGITNSTGEWEATFLNRHDNVAVGVDDQPIAVTGRFDASIPNVRHIVGAFGAHRTTDPVPGS